MKKSKPAPDLDYLEKYVPQIRKNLMKAQQAQDTVRVQKLSTKLTKKAALLHKLRIAQVERQRAERLEFQQTRSRERKAERAAAKSNNDESDNTSIQGDDDEIEVSKEQHQRPKPSLNSFFQIVS